VRPRRGPPTLHQVTTKMSGKIARDPDVFV
jgi:hypothetical protein